jgi:hypothetical protein
MVIRLMRAVLVHRRFGRWLGLCLCLALGPVWPAGAQTKEYQIKAAFLFNFAQFVDWPAAAVTNTASFRIGVLGDNPFGEALDKIVQGESIKKQKIVVQRTHRVEDLKGCQMVFICKSEQGHLPEVMSKLGGGAVLTVSEVDGFAQQGGIINFFPEGTKVRFEINPEAAQKAGLKLSSQLLSLGKIVKSAKPAP